MNRLLSFLIVISLALFSSLSGAQEGGDVYDPFVDYSEFDSNSDEEADINFFQNGRLFTLGFNLGYRTFTGNLGNIYDPSPAFGFYLSYFFDLRFALQLTYLTGDHDIGFTSRPSDKFVSGTISLDEFGLSMKYYLNTQNMTRGIAKLNPYVTGGLFNVSRTAKLAGQSSFGKDSGMGADVGFGVEIPIRNDEMYLGVQGNYRLVNFKEENTEITIDNGNENTGIIPNGDILMMNFILGVNF